MGRVRRWVVPEGVVDGATVFLCEDAGGYGFGGEAYDGCLRRLRCCVRWIVRGSCFSVWGCRRARVWCEAGVVRVRWKWWMKVWRSRLYCLRVRWMPRVVLCRCR